MNKRKTVINKALSLVFVVLIFSLSALLIFLPDKSFSEEENRPLQTLPAFSFESLASGEYTKNITSYFSDQFPFRDGFVGAKAVSEILLLKNENNRVILGKDGYIIKRPSISSYDMLGYNLKTIEKFAKKLDGKGIDLTLFVAGRSIDVMQSKLPALYPKDSQEEIWKYLESNVSDSYKYVNLMKPLKQKADSGEYVYYKTDHHWTTLGAYYGYLGIMESMGKTAKPLDYFTPEKKSDAFYGTTWSSSGMKWIEPDDLYYFRYAGDDDFKVEFLLSGTEKQGFYDESYLSKKDKYSSFLYGNNPILRISKNGSDGENREKLLVIKDSFANSVIPFLAVDYDLIVVDMRYYNDLLSPVIDAEGIDSVIILLNLDSLAESRAILGMMAAE